MKTVSHRLRDQSGYSMVEVLAAIVILSLAILPMVSMFDAGLRAAVLGGNYDKGRAVANANLEDVKADPSSYPPSGSPYDCRVTNSSPPDMTCKVETKYIRLDAPVGSDTAEFEDGGSGLIKVAVTVEWSSNSYITSGVTTS